MATWPYYKVRLGKDPIMAGYHVEGVDVELWLIGYGIYCSSHHYVSGDEERSETEGLVKIINKQCAQRELGF